MNGNIYYVSLVSENSLAVLIDAFNTDGESRYFHGAFKNTIRDLPANIRVEIKDAYETDQTFFSFWESHGRLGRCGLQ